MTTPFAPPVRPSAAILPSSPRLALLDAQCERMADRSFTTALRIIGDTSRAEALVRAIFVEAGRKLPFTAANRDRADSQLLSTAAANIGCG